jgi:hypothetical protein
MGNSARYKTNRKQSIKIKALHAPNAALSASRWGKTRGAALGIFMNRLCAAFATIPYANDNDRTLRFPALASPQL